MKTKDFIKAINALPTLKKKQLFYLNDVVNHYNSNNRAVLAGSCTYKPTEHSEGCAIGRRCDVTIANSLFEGRSVGSESVFNNIPKWMQDLTVTFLNSVQALHDNKAYWDELGLSALGSLQVNCIKKVYELT